MAPTTESAGATKERAILQPSEAVARRGDQHWPPGPPVVCEQAAAARPQEVSVAERSAAKAVGRILRRRPVNVQLLAGSQPPPAAELAVTLSLSS